MHGMSNTNHTIAVNLAERWKSVPLPLEPDNDYMPLDCKPE